MPVAAMRIDDLPMILGCQANLPLREVARQLVENKVGALAVLAEKRLVGIITERDLAAALAESRDPDATTAQAYASAEVRTAGPSEDSREVARRRLEARVRHLPAGDDTGQPAGMASMHDLLTLGTWA